MKIIKKKEDIIEGYTGRKLEQYVWIPKSKTYLREYREFLKICYKIQEKDGFFNDRNVGEEMVNCRAIVDRDSTKESYIKKYETKSIGNQSYVSNARMMIRISRWLGWITKQKDVSKFELTPYGINLTKFAGDFPAKCGGINEQELMLRAFTKLKFYSVNDSPQYRNFRFKQRIFLNMLKILSNFDYCSHYELVVSAFTLKEERNKEEFKSALNRIKQLKGGKLTIGSALKEFDIDCKNKSRVTGVYDGPKVMLSFARQLGLVENIPVNRKLTPQIFEEYKQMYRGSGHIKTSGVKFVSKITELGKKIVEKYSKEEIIWFDELNEKIDCSAILIYLNKMKNTLNLQKLKEKNFDKAIEELNHKKIIKIDGSLITLNINTDFDLYQDIPYEKRDEVLTRLTQLKASFLESYLLDIDSSNIKELFVEESSFKLGECIYCANSPCKNYAEYSNKHGASDRFADRVCPMDIISSSEKGEIQIKESLCIGCMLCVPRCPFLALSLTSSSIEQKKAKTYVEINYSDKILHTAKLINKEGVKFKVEINKINDIIKNFENKIKVPGKELKKDIIYVLVRNIFRSLGFNAVYSGSGGMKTRSDVTLLSPYLITSEIKSPAEGPINLKAVRQAVDAAVQAETFLTMAIGDITHKGAIDQEKKYRKLNPNLKICLLELKYLMFLFLVKDDLKLNPESIKYLLENYPGHFDGESILRFITHEAKKSNIEKKVYDEIIREAKKLINGY